MKINQLKIENCQRIKLFELSPDNNLIIIGGDNAQGKTSVLESIKMLLGGKRAQVSEPVRRGTDEAHIYMTTDTGIEIEKTIQPGGKEKFVVKGPRAGNGQTFINTLYNKNTIDPLAFSVTEKAKQREVLLGLVGVDPTAIDNKIKDVYSERTEVNKKLKEVETQVNAAPYYPDIANEEISVSEVAEQLREANNKALAADRLRNQLKNLKDEKASLKRRLEVIDKEGSDAAGRLKNISVPDITNLEVKLNGIEEHNQKARANKAKEALKVYHEKYAKETNRLHTQIEGLRLKKTELLQSAKFPVDGLSFDEEQVLYQEIPFEQASGAEKLRVSTAIGIALQPELKVLLIRDGSLLDDKNLEMLRQMAEEHDAQIWLERVGHDEQATVIIEDGRIKEDNTSDIQISESSNASVS